MNINLEQGGRYFQKVAFGNTTFEKIVPTLNTNFTVEKW